VDVKDAAPPDGLPRAWLAVLAALPAFAAPLLAALAVIAILWPLGFAPARVIGLTASVIGEAFGQGRGIVLATSGKLLVAGLAVAIAFRAGLFNIGVEGQLLMAGLGVIVVGLAIGMWPPFVAIPLLVATGMIAGGLWAGIAGAIRAYARGHEVIATIMLNVVAMAVVKWALNPRFPLVAQGSITSRPMEPSLRYPMLADYAPLLFGGSRATLGFVLALVALAAFAYFLARRPGGLSLRALGLSSSGAQAAGIDVRRGLLLAMIASGACAGLLGTEEVMARGSFAEDISQGFGYTGIAVALLAGEAWWGLPIAALFFGVLEYAKVPLGMEGIPREIVSIAQALVIVALLFARHAALLLRQRLEARYRQRSA